MTNTTVLETGNPKNPLFTKLRRRFSYEGNRTVAEYMMDQVLKREGAVKERCRTSEFQYLKANNLPRNNAASAGRARPAKQKNTMLRTVLAVLLCLALALTVVYMVATNYRLNRQLEMLESQNAAREYSDAVNGEYIGMPQEGAVMYFAEEELDEVSF